MRDFLSPRKKGEQKKGGGRGIKEPAAGKYWPARPALEDSVEREYENNDLAATLAVSADATGVAIAGGYKISAPAGYAGREIGLRRMRERFSFHEIVESQ